MAFLRLCLFQRNTKISHQNLCPDLGMKNLGAVQSTLHIAGLREHLPKQTGTWTLGVFTGGKGVGRDKHGGCAVSNGRLLCLPPEAEALLRGHTEID